METAAKGRGAACSLDFKQKKLPNTTFQSTFLLISDKAHIFGRHYCSLNVRKPRNSNFILRLKPKDAPISVTRKREDLSPASMKPAAGLRGEN